MLNITLNFMEEELEEILKKANELGIMIQDTNVYKNFNAVLQRLNKDEEAVRLLETYTAFAEDIQARSRNGDIIENHEKERMRELSMAVRDSELLAQFVKARDAYMDLLLEIHAAIEKGE